MHEKKIQRENRIVFERKVLGKTKEDIYFVRKEFKKYVKKQRKTYEKGGDGIVIKTEKV